MSGPSPAELARLAVASPTMAAAAYQAAIQGGVVGGYPNPGMQPQPLPPNVSPQVLGSIGKGAFTAVYQYSLEDGT